MSVTVCLCGNGNSFYYPNSGGLEWMYLNWALGLRSLGCRVVWLEPVWPDTPLDQLRAGVAGLKNLIERYSPADDIALCSRTVDPLPPGATDGCLDLSAATEADLLLSLGIYELPPKVVERFKRSALVDGDPGGTQIWISQGNLKLSRYDTK